MPVEIALDSLIVPSTTWDSNARPVIPVGLDGETIAPFAIDLQRMHGLIVTGTPGSGKTTLVQSLLLAMAEQLSPDRVELYLNGVVDAQLQPFKQLPHTKAYLETSTEFAECIEHMTHLLRQREQAFRQVSSDGRQDRQSFLANYPFLILAIDDYSDTRSIISSEIFDDTWKSLLKLGRSYKLIVVLSAPASYFQSAVYSDELFKDLKQQHQPVILLGGTDSESTTLFNIRLRPEERNLIFDHPGRGYYKYRNEQRLLQTASCHIGSLSMTEWIRRIRQKS